MKSFTIPAQSGAGVMKQHLSDLGMQSGEYGLRGSLWIERWNDQRVWEVQCLKYFFGWSGLVWAPAFSNVFRMSLSCSVWPFFSAQVPALENER